MAHGRYIHRYRSGRWAKPGSAAFARWASMVEYNPHGADVGDYNVDLDDLLSRIEHDGRIVTGIGYETPAEEIDFVAGDKRRIPEDAKPPPRRKQKSTRTLKQLGVIPSKPNKNQRRAAFWRDFRSNDSPSEGAPETPVAKGRLPGD